MMIGAAMAGSLLIYVILVEMFKSFQKPVGPSAGRSYLDVVRFVIYVASLAQFIVVGFVRGAILKRAPCENVELLIEKLTVASIVTLGICEVPAVMGLVLFFVGGFRADFYILLGASMLMLFLYFPRYERWKAWVRKKAPLQWDA
jgi:hypothetical protein